MPEYCQVETILKCNQQTFQPILRQLSRLLLQLGYDRTDVISWLSQLTWPPDVKDGEATALILHQMIAVNGFDPIPGAGLEILTQRDVVSTSLDNGWLALHILFNAETVRDIDTGLYEPKFGKVLWSLFQQLARVFKDWGIYFTDEWQEGRVLWSITGMSQEMNIWAFDLALIPIAHAAHFKAISDLFQKIDLNDWVGYARSDRWLTLPWEGAI